MSWMNETNLTQAVAEIKAFCQGAFAALTHKHTTLGDANATVLTVDPTNKSVVTGTVAVSPYDDPGTNSFTEGDGCTASGSASHAEGTSSWAEGPASHAEGYHTRATGDASHTEGSMSDATGDYSHAEGYSSEASGYTAHAEGDNTSSEGHGSHAEGTGSHAYGSSSHAEGTDTVARLEASHAEGVCSEATSYASHAEGGYTKAASRFQHVQGKYNVADSLNTYAHIVGGGTEQTPKDIQTLDWNGNLAQGTVNHASCYTESNIAAKEATTGAGFCLVSGVRVSVKFMYAQTAAAAITLNVNSTGAKTVYVGGSATSSSNPCTWPADAICEFVYVNNAWYYLGNNIDGAAGLASLRDSVSPTDLSSQYGPTSNATSIRKACTTIGKLCIISGIGTTTAELPASGYLTVWACPTTTHYHECFMTLYDSSTRIRGYVEGNGVTIWNDTGAAIPAGRIFVFLAVYAMQ